MRNKSRKLNRNEHVHHLNGNKLDNRIENLSVLVDKEHGKLHSKEYNNIIKVYQDRISYLENKLKSINRR